LRAADEVSVLVLGEKRRHYKGKDYRVHSVVRHSETQAEMVLYETLYPSPGGRLWVRPRAMFEGELEVDGRSVGRFAKLPASEPVGPEVAVEGQLRAYNARDLDAFVRWYDPRIEIRHLTSGRLVLDGREELEERYGAMFREWPKLRCESVYREVLGDLVVEHERLDGHPRGDGVAAVVLFKVEKGLIRHLWVAD
jgi:hypothetical protein